MIRDISGYKKEDNNAQGTIKIALKYDPITKDPVIKKLSVQVPGLRKYQGLSTFTSTQWTWYCYHVYVQWSDDWKASKRENVGGEVLLRLLKNSKKVYMSRIGNNPITIPEGVVVDIQSDVITVKGKLGELSQPYDSVSFTRRFDIEVSRPSEANQHKAKHGLYRALVNNMVEGRFQGLPSWNLLVLDIVHLIKVKS